MRVAYTVFLVLCFSFSIHAQTFSVDSVASAALNAVQLAATSWGDFDADGDFDLVISGEDSLGIKSTVLYVNEGPAGFADSGQLLLPVSEGSLAWFDFDNDGDIDLLLTGLDPLGNSITKIYRNDQGSLVDAIIQLPGISSSAAFWADFNSDGRFDLLLSGRDINGDATARIYRNDGGTFFDVDAALMGFHGGSALWADVNGDNLPDAFLSGENFDGQADARIYLNKGDGTFSDTGTNIPSLVQSSAAFGDFNEDGDLDLVIGGRASDSVATTRVYRNDGSGTFFEVAELTGLYRGSAVWGDVDNDGSLDILVTGLRADSIAQTLIFLNQGDGSFSNLQAGFRGISDGSGSLVDYDGDGDLDVALVGTDSSGAPVARIYMNNSPTPNTLPSIPQSLTTRLSQSTLNLSWRGSSDTETDSLGLHYNLRVGTTPGGNELWSAMSSGSGARFVNVRGNMNNSTQLDIPVSRIKAVPAIYWTVQALDNHFAASAFASEEIFRQTFVLDSLATNALPGVNASHVSWADYDRDGDYDLFISGQNNQNQRIAQIFRNEGKSRFVDSGVILEGVAASASAWNDYDKDGDLDLVLLGINASSEPIANLYRNDDNTGLTLIPTELIGVFQSAVDWGDYDGDGDSDLLLIGFSGTRNIARIYNNDDGHYVDIEAALIGMQAGAAKWADFDNDGHLDVLLAGASDTGSVSKIYRNDGHGNFDEQQANLVGISSGSASIADYDADGDADILISGSASGGRVSLIYRNDGDFSFFNVPAGLHGVSNGSNSWIDFDSDGDLDVVLSGFDNSFSRIARVYRNDGNDEFFNLNALLDGVIFGSLAVGDYDGDGTQDFVLTGSSTSSRVTQVYKNTSQKVNTPPEAPVTSLSDFTMTSLAFDWENSIDAEMPDDGLTYNLRVGTRPEAGNILPAMSLTDGSRLLPGARGNAGHLNRRVISIANLLDFPGVYWSVQAVDNQGEGSAFSDEIGFAPRLVAIEDIPFDEGKRVRLRWNASGLDHDVNRLTSYSVWRAIPYAGANQVYDASHRKSARLRRSTVTSADLTWEWLATLPAHRRSDYAYTAATLYDSSKSTNGMHHFLVSAHTNDANIFFDSQPDSGFSVDNIRPNAPTQLAGSFDGHQLVLHWQRNKEADLKDYLIYKSEEPGTELSSRELFASTRDTFLVSQNVQFETNSYFIVAAQDSSDNLSDPSEEFALILTSVTGASETIPKRFALHQNYPNPFNPATQIRFDLPHDSQVTIEIFSILGTYVTTLLDEHTSAGAHQLTFDGSQLATGAYFYRIKATSTESGSASNFVEVRKMILLR